MKYIIVILGLIISFSSCNSYQKNTEKGATTEENDTIRIKNDSLEYEIIIIEPGFYSWLQTQRPRGYYGLGYLENRNILYVTEYNRRVINPQLYDPNLYFQQINYDFNTNYGYEVNYLLYNYFVYFQQRYNQKFITGRGY